MIVLSALFLVVNTLACFLVIFPFAAVKAVVPFPSIRRKTTRAVEVIAGAWVSFNTAFFKALGLIRLEATGAIPQDLGKSYLIFANHQSWVDIIMLQAIFNGRIPFIRFFTKSELFWVPFVGIAWWALDFPFMKRYSRSEVLKDPRKKEVDLNATKEACRRFRGQHISLLNFLEGTRFSLEKREHQKSPFKNLLLPKSGGTFHVITEMGSEFASVLDVTIFYPEGPKSFLAFLNGQVGKVQIHVDQIQIPSFLLDARGMSTDEQRQRTSDWVLARWAVKDEFLERMKESTSSSSTGQTVGGERLSRL